MKNRILTNSFRTIKRSFSRFIPLFVMSFLGVFVFAGLQSVKPDMMTTLDNFLDEHNIYDLQVISTGGLTDDDVDAIRQIEGITDVEYSYSLDKIIKIEENDLVINISSLPKTINSLKLMEGKFPSQNNEIVVENNFIKKTSYKIGDTIYIEDEKLKEHSYVIVGTVESGLYFNNDELKQDRGTTTVGSGTVSYYTYVLEDDFIQEYYNSIYITVDDAIHKLTASEDYNHLIEKIKSTVNDIKSAQETARYHSIYTEFENEIKNNENKVNEELKKIKMPTWYIYDRTNHPTYLDYVDDTKSVDNLSKIFPIVFFAVAILVSLISMNRMVEEDRIEIGTLKSLGFSNKEIMLKYLMFSMIATLFGGLLGGILGILILPALVFSIYGMLFNVPNFYVGLNLSKIVISLLISVLCICGTTIFTVLKVVKEKPSDLMRPKAPKAGKRIILERWNFFWKTISFSNKVTLRNLFRYKKRGIVTIIGIAGCSALMLCGFGIRDAIVDIADMQFIETFTYDAMVYVNDIQDKTSDIFNSKYIDDIVEIQNINVKKDTTSANMFIVDKEEIAKIVNLVDKEGKQLKIESGKVIITDKFADLTNLKVGDTLNVVDDNNESYSYEISGIAKNYLMHYIYIDKDTFKENNEYSSNVIYLNLNDTTQTVEEELSKELMDKDEVLNISFVQELLNNASDMLTSLNKVVAIIIVLSATLSFVVLYNLSNININERKREISTLKVLGFHDKEVDNYITKENIIFTIFGILLGLFAGYFLTKIVIITVEIEKARFIHHISLNSYIYTAIITIIFTLIVNLVTHFNLKKIDMIASLKSVD